MRPTQDPCSGWRHAARTAASAAVLVAVPMMSGAANSPSASCFPTSVAWKGRVVSTDACLGPGSYQVLGPNGTATSASVGEMDPRDVIVTLREPALAETVRHYVRDRRGLRTNSRPRLPLAVSAAFERLKAGHTRFRESLRAAAAEVERSRPGAWPRTQVRREYLRVLNGVALRAPSAVIERLRRHPQVAAVHPDRQIQAVLDESVPLIEAPVLWNQGITGQGVVVGIIDTGVDYTHPDLGGGFGPGFKVVGGYDFVNNDADPMDDSSHGHGTHVAGIVAGNGTIRGVAPDALLVAYKVLAAIGGGSTSDVIAAIDRSIDPDGDPATDDALDVINLSLGGDGDPDDPLSMAVDRAFDAGVLPVVAAGNSGSSYATIGSPGCARKALTVGATDDADQIAAFSSRGPTPLTFALKPDVVAPGVAVNSSIPGASHTTISGTSMATPHVAGAAALLLQRDPTLTPTALKSALMTSARDVGLDPFTQGHGRIDVAAAALVTTVVDPPSVSFGRSDTGPPVFHGSATVTVTNRSTTAREYSVVLVSAGFPDGLAAAVRPATLTLVPGESGPLTLELSLDHARVPKVPQPPYSYGGVVRVADAAEQIEIPFSVVKAPSLHLHFDAPPTLALIWDAQGRVSEHWFPGPDLHLMRPDMPHNVMAWFDETLPSGHNRTRAVLREGLAVDTSHTLRSDAAIHRVRFDLRDERGRALLPNQVTWTFRPPTGDFGVLGWTDPLGELYFSDIPIRFHLDWLLHSEQPAPRAALYTVSGVRRGVAGDLTFKNDPRALRRLELDFDLAEPAETLGVGHVVVSSIGSWTGFSVAHLQHPAPQHQVIYASFDASPNAAALGFQASVRPADAGAPWMWFFAKTVHETAIFRPHDGVTDLMGVSRIAPHWDSRRPMETTRATMFSVGLEPTSWFGRLVNTPTSIQPLSSLGGTFTLFVDQAMGLRATSALPYQLLQGDTVVRNGTFPGGSGGFFDWIPPLSVAPGRYTMNVRGPSDTVAGIASSSLASTTFDSSATDPNPPYLSHFGITTIAGRPVRRVHFAQPAEVRFKAHDDARLDSVQLSYRVGPDEPWRRLPLVHVAGLYRTLLPTWLKPPRQGELPISLKIDARDAQGNSLTHRLEPAVGLTLHPLPAEP